MKDTHIETPETAAAGETKAPLLSRPRLVAAATALGGMIVGSIVGLGVRFGVESTGLLGPSVRALIAEQEANFTEINQRLDAIQGLSTDPEVNQGLAELGKLLRRQDELARQASAELAYLGEHVAALKAEQLSQAGFATGADFWLKGGESVSVGGRNQVFGLLSTRRNAADVNLSGTRKRLFVGDAVSVSGENRACTVFYKVATPRADGRVGFDLSCG